MSRPIFDPNAAERPLTEYEKELLTCLMEEAAEVIQTASKLIRFGYGNTNPSTGRKNYQELGLELGDMSTIVKRCCGAKLFFMKDMNAGEERKAERLLKYLRNTPDAKPQN